MQVTARWERWEPDGSGVVGVLRAWPCLVWPCVRGDVRGDMCEDLRGDVRGDVQVVLNMALFAEMAVKKGCATPPPPRRQGPRPRSRARRKLWPGTLGGRLPCSKLRRERAGSGGVPPTQQTAAAEHRGAAGAERQGVQQRLQQRCRWRLRARARARVRERGMGAEESGE